MNVTIENLTMVYKGGRRALDGVDLTVGTGMIGLLGPNGAGKTTALRALAGLERLDAGRILVGGQDITTCPTMPAATSLTSPACRPCQTPKGMDTKTIIKNDITVKVMVMGSFGMSISFTEME